MVKTEEIRYCCKVCNFEHPFKDGILEHMKGHVGVKIISSEFEKMETKTKENYLKDKCDCGKMKGKRNKTCRDCYRSSQNTGSGKQ